MPSTKYGHYVTEKPVETVGVIHCLPALQYVEEPDKIICGN